MSVVYAKHILWYAEITNFADILKKRKTNSTVGGILSSGILSVAFCSDTDFHTIAGATMAVL